ncbi:MAG TPA: chemotaxis protein CheW [Elusimicrobiota bacterium]|nr:chemotaxis protein CheW [Elusimicrobiota bacterium]
MPAESAAPSRGARLVQFVIFKLAEEDFAIPIDEVREIIRAVPVTPVPGAPRSIRGMINVRGEVASVIDLKARFSLREKFSLEPKHIIITAQMKTLFAFTVDEVTEILRIMENEIKTTPMTGLRVEENYVTGVVIREGRLIALLDLAKVLAEPAPAGAASAGA